MIVPMLKTVVVCRTADKPAALERLRSLGLLHVEHTRRPDSPALADFDQKILRLKQVVNILSDRKVARSSGSVAPAAAAAEVEAALSESNDLSKRLDDLRRDWERLEPWGDFSFELLSELSSKGLKVHLCACQDEQLAFLKTKGALQIVRRSKGRIFAALVSENDFHPGELPLAQMPAARRSFSDVEKEIRTVERAVAESSRRLDRCASTLPSVEQRLLELQGEREFAANIEGMGVDGEVAYIQGYAPAERSAELFTVAKECSWALLTSTPTSADSPPTLLRPPKLLTISKPIFDFIGLAPGYKEWDVSSCFLFFFTIYYAMIVGDAGYGLLFLVIGLFLKYKLKGESYRLPLNLFITLSVGTVVWGAMNGAYFGIPIEVLPNFMHGLGFFTADKELGQKHIQLICFILAAVHLGFARLWKASLKGFRLKALGQVGWAFLVWGNLFTATKLIVFPSMAMPSFVFGLYGVGLLFILLFHVEWHNIDDVFNLPFELIGTFSDLLSFIRLFAVGLAGLYIAESFNNMSLMVFHISPWLFPMGVIVLLAGHMLNIALCFLGVLVHGIRLNTLEFSNHMGMQWIGHVFSPFKSIQPQGKAP